MVKWDASKYRSDAKLTEVLVAASRVFNEVATEHKETKIDKKESF